jgi:hypothetical protein
MSSTSSQESAGSVSGSKEPECEQLDSAKSIPIAAPSSLSGGLMSATWETFVPWTLNRSPPWSL